MYFSRDITYWLIFDKPRFCAESKLSHILIIMTYIVKTTLQSTTFARFKSLILFIIEVCSL